MFEIKFKTELILNPQKYYQDLIDKLPFSLNKIYYGGDINSLFPSKFMDNHGLRLLERFVTMEHGIFYRYENTNEFFPEEINKYLEVLLSLDNGFIYLDCPDYKKTKNHLDGEQFDLNVLNNNQLEVLLGREVVKTLDVLNVVFVENKGKFKFKFNDSELILKF